MYVSTKPCRSEQLSATLGSRAGAVRWGFIWHQLRRSPRPFCLSTDQQAQESMKRLFSAFQAHRIFVCTCVAFESLVDRPTQTWGGGQSAVCVLDNTHSLVPYCTAIIRYYRSHSKGHWDLVGRQLSSKRIASPKNTTHRMGTS